MADLKTDLASLKIDRSARDRGGRLGLWIGAAAAVLVLAAGAWYWATQAQAATVRTAAVEARTEGAAGISGAVLNASGYVTARRRATVSSKVTGKVIEINVEEGMKVRRGQVLARLDDTQVRAALALAVSQLAQARRAVTETEVRLREAELNLKRQRQLAKEGVIGQADLDTAEAQFDSLKARIDVGRQEVEVADRNVAIHQTDLNDMVVRAPFDGVAISKDAQPGEMVSPVSAGGGFTRTGISTIVDMSSLEIEVDVNESYINRVSEDQPVTAVLDAYPDWRIPAHVITTIPTADRQKATVLVRIGFEKLDPRILPDMGVKVAFHAPNEARAGGADAAPAPQARLLVPKTAVRKSNGQDVVFVLKESRVERRAVRVGTADGDRVEIVSGVTAGEFVVIDGPPELADGTRVRVQGD
ncbi:MAG TPA: efflux RND transporter periplasmic adaptor subunit [Vicinamibacterales bacterium]|nr:efflux RND transporter periplasmic adaptor subunit [Vicinamibacterales bacterium]